MEDDAASRRLVRALLRPCGYRLFKRDSLYGARELLSTHRPSLLLLDVRVINGTGIDLAKDIRASGTPKRLPIIALKAQALKAGVERILGVGIDRYVPEPLDTRLLVNAVNELIGIRGRELE